MTNTTKVISIFLTSLSLLVHSCGVVDLPEPYPSPSLRRQIDVRRTSPQDIIQIPNIEETIYCTNTVGRTCLIKIKIPECGYEDNSFPTINSRYILEHQSEFRNFTSIPVVDRTSTFIEKISYIQLLTDLRVRGCHLSQFNIVYWQYSEDSYQNGLYPSRTTHRLWRATTVTEEFLRDVAPEEYTR